MTISNTDEQQAAQAVCLCMASAGRECALLPQIDRPMPLEPPVVVVLSYRN